MQVMFRSYAGQVEVTCRSCLGHMQVKWRSHACSWKDVLTSRSILCHVLPGSLKMLCPQQMLPRG